MSELGKNKILGALGLVGALYLLKDEIGKVVSFGLKEFMADVYNSTVTQLGATGAVKSSEVFNYYMPKIAPLNYQLVVNSVIGVSIILTLSIAGYALSYLKNR